MSLEKEVVDALIIRCGLIEDFQKGDRELIKVALENIGGFGKRVDALEARLRALEAAEVSR